MVILRFKIPSKPDKTDELMAALAEILGPARDFDIARVLRDPIPLSRPRSMRTAPLSNEPPSTPTLV